MRYVTKCKSLIYSIKMKEIHLLIFNVEYGIIIIIRWYKYRYVNHYNYDVRCDERRKIANTSHSY